MKAGGSALTSLLGRAIPPFALRVTLLLPLLGLPPALLGHAAVGAGAASGPGPVRGTNLKKRQLNRHIDWTRNGANRDPYYQLPGAFYSNVTNATPAALVAYSASLGADALQVDAMNEFGYASWLSAVPDQPVYPVLARLQLDWLGAMRDALRARGMGLYIYLPLAYNQHWADTHNGSTYPNWVTSVCFNDRGYLEHYLSLTHELLQRYQPDGFRFDGFSQQHDPWVCRTPGDQDFYRALYGGEEMPLVFNESNWRRGIDFGRATMARFLTEIRRAALAEDPDVLTWANTFTPNSAAKDIWVDWNLGHNVTDVGFVEDATDSSSAEYAFLVQLGRGFQATRGFVSGQWCGFDTGQQQRAEQGLATGSGVRAAGGGPGIATSSHLAVSMGGNMYNYIEYFNKSAGLPTEPSACCGHPGRPGQSIGIFASDARELYGTFMADNDEYLQGAVPVDYAALVISEETRYRWQHYDRTQLKVAMQAIFGHYFDRSTTLSFVLNLDLPKTDLVGRYKLLVVLETSGLADAEAAALERYARAGGKLLLVGGAGLFDATGAPLPDYQLAAVQGLRWTGRHCELSTDGGKAAEASRAPVVAHPASFCCVNGGPTECGDPSGNFTLVENVSLAQCSKACGRLSCPCYDYSPKPPHPGQSQCRVVAHGYPFQLDGTHPYTTAYTTVPVSPPGPPPPPPGPPPPPSPSPECVELATPTTAVPSAKKTAAGHPLFYTNTAGQGTVVTVTLDAVTVTNASGAAGAPPPPQLTPLLLEHVQHLAGPAPLLVGNGTAAAADVVLRIQNTSQSGPRWVLHFLTDEELVVQLNPRYIAASRIVWQYPSEGWNCSLTGSTTLNVKPGTGVHGRLVALKSDDQDSC
jgi:hypothetical protein